MRILVTNDDGIEAPGLKFAEKIARQLSDDVWVIAPAKEQSGKSHAVSFGFSFYATKLEEKRIAVDGTPADCVALAVCHYMKALPDLVISGVNFGVNMGDAVSLSGTVGAAEEAAMQGIPAIALSQQYDENNQNSEDVWATVDKHGLSVIEKLLGADLPKYGVMNVNFPCLNDGEVKGVKLTTQGRSHYQDYIEATQDFEGRDCFRICWGYPKLEAKENSDRLAVKHGYISITPLLTNRTDFAALQELGDAI